MRVRGLPNLNRVYAAGGAFTVPSARAYACGLTSQGEAWCWGGAIRGDLWEGPTDGPIRIARDIPFRTLALGAEHLCGLTTESWAFCGGGNYAGQIGDGTTVDRSGMVGVKGP
jgi:alpha-tubulin suppressor-like RCC1 family protein